MKILGTIVPLFLLVSSIKASAALVLYTDRAAWRIAAGGGVGDIFDNLNTGTGSRTGYAINGDAFVAFPNANASTAIDGIGYARFLLDNVRYAGTFTFSTAVSALGFDINPQPADVGVAIGVYVDGNPDTGYNLPATDVNAFVGFVSDAPFSSFLFTTEFAYSGWHGVDNLEAFVVPEPSTYFAAGFLTLAAGYHFVRSRRTQLAN